MAAAQDVDRGRGKLAAERERGGGGGAIDDIAVVVVEGEGSDRAVAVEQDMSGGGGNGPEEISAGAGRVGECARGPVGVGIPIALRGVEGPLGCAAAEDQGSIEAGICGGGGEAEAELGFERTAAGVGDAAKIDDVVGEECLGGGYGKESLIDDGDAFFEQLNAEFAEAGASDDWVGEADQESVGVVEARVID